VADGSASPWVWRSASSAAATLRTVLIPAELGYRGAIALRNALYDAGALPSHRPPIPVLSIGNLSVGGTGKTPLAAWAAAELRLRGASPAVVLRGYGDDEPLVHERLNPEIPVIVASDRVRGVEEARQGGADVAVLDDAFQHRRIRRTEDWVLISADRWSERRRLLPAGPWREPIAALRRASAVIVTRKAASPAAAATVAEVARRAGHAPVATAYLALDAIHDARTSATRSLGSLNGSRIFLMTGIGDPGALRAQLEAEGAVVRERRFPDHHAFSDGELQELGRAANEDVVVCTLKDAVKVAPRWPRGAPAIWYVSQRVRIESGADVLARSLDSVLRARTNGETSAGGVRPSL
jgi:tetraacyldisaccharide 4'-kinase